MDWKLVIAIIGLPAAAGAIVDAWSTWTQKRRLHDELCRLFLKLDDTSVHDLPKSMAAITLSMFAAVLGRRSISWRLVAVSFLISAPLTVLAVYLGNLGMLYTMAADAFANSLKVLTFLSVLDWLVLLSINFVCDFLTILITCHVLRLISDRSRRVLPLILSDAACAYLLAAVCSAAMLSISDQQMSLHFFLSRFFWVLSSLPRFWFTLLGDGFTRPYELMGIVGFYASTTLVPTLLYLFVLGVLAFAKLLLIVGRSLAMQWCDVATQIDPSRGPDLASSAARFKPFTLLGLAFSGVVATVRVLHLLLIAAK